MNDITEAEKKLNSCACGGIYKIHYWDKLGYFAVCREYECCHTTLEFDTLDELVEAINRA